MVSPLLHSTVMSLYVEQAPTTLSPPGL